MDKVKLYIASSVGELNIKGEYKYDSNRSMKLHINHSETTFKAAEGARLKGDEERAYVLYMRYIDIYRKVKQSREFKKDPNHFGLLLGSKKVTDSLGHAEVLNKSLKQRYEDAKLEKDAAKDDQIISHELPNGVILPKGDTSATKNKPGPKAEAPLVPNDAKSITCGVLHKVQFSKSAKDYKVLIIDVRNEISFEESHIRHDDCINVPSPLLIPGTICERIQKGITNGDHLKRWDKRAEYNLIVMLDWFCEEKDLTDQPNPLKCLFDALHKWEQNIFLQHAPVVLTGGYADWVEFYPQLTTNPKIEIPKKEKPGIVSIASLSDVNFTSLLIPTKVNDSAEIQQNDVNDDIKANGDVSISGSNGDVAQSMTSPAAKQTDDIFANWKISNASSAIASSTFAKDVPDVAESNSNKRQPGKTRTMPVIDRATKPGSIKESVSAPIPKKTDDWDSIFSDLEASSAQENSKNQESDSNTPSQNGQSRSNSKAESSSINSSIIDVQNRLEVAKKKKEEDEEKRRELEEKMKLFELEQEVKRLEKEAEEEALLRKKAEKDLAMKMRGLRPSESHNKTKTDEPAASDVKGQPDKPVVVSDNKPSVKENTSSSVKSAELKQPVKTGTSSEVKVDTVKSKKISESSAEKDTAAAPLKPVSTGSNHPANVETVSKPKVQDVPPTTGQMPPKEIPNRVGKPVTTTGQGPSKPKQGTETPSVTPKASASSKPAPNREAKPAVSTSSNSVVKPSRPLPTPQPATPAAQPATPAAPKPQTPSVSSETKFDGVHDKNELTLSTSLPMNWEKRLDRKTGRYFYLDHNTKTSHWNLPSSVSVKRPSKKIVPLKDEPSSSSGGLKRSSSTPNIAQLADDQPIKPLKPSVNRSSKPTLQKQEDFLDPPDVYARNLAQLHPTNGGRGPGQCGLYNLGNTCYMNSVLQCMFSTALLVKYFLQNEYKHDMNRENFLGSGGEITDGFAVLMKAVWNGKFKNVTPRDFRNTIGRFNTRFSSYSQQDSQELLLFLMDGLHEDLNLIRKREYKEEEDNDNMADGDAAKMAWDFHKRLNESIIVELFQGQFKAATQCLYCRKTSRKFDVFMYLSLPLPSRGGCSITDCLDKFSEVEKLSGDNKWFCPNCKQDRDAVRKMEIWRLPPVLLIHFKRFSFSGRWGDKLQTNVSFPTTNLNINKYVIGPKSKNSFSLYAVSHHHGATMDSGHYVASCKNPIDGNWYKYDDHEVSKTSVPSGSSAYILCYTSLSHTLTLTN